MSATRGNPFCLEDRQKLTDDMFCEEVLESGDIHHISDAREDERWKNSPMINHDVDVPLQA
ncbi:MAG: hypothetical protein IH630_00510 [Thermoplasmata archaeon]|nr:hypothetical protein [Thermoplasmata archaeon]MCJ7562792.1 hypothetical protein [Thermoplasmata archaeon]